MIGTAVAGATANDCRQTPELDRSMTTDPLLYGIETGHIRLAQRPS